MFEQAQHVITTVIGSNGGQATAWQMAIRAVIVYGGSLVLVRLGKKRFLGQNSAFDVVLLIILGSVLSRGVNGSAPMGTTLVAGIALIALHWLASFLALHSDRVSNLVKGRSSVLIREGQMCRDNIRESHLTQSDLDEGLRQGGIESAESVRVAHLERSGQISVVRKDRQCHVAEVRMKDGVQVVRIEISEPKYSSAG